MENKLEHGDERDDDGEFWNNVFFEGERPGISPLHSFVFRFLETGDSIGGYEVSKSRVGAKIRANSGLNFWIEGVTMKHFTVCFMRCFR